MATSLSSLRLNPLGSGSARTRLALSFHCWPGGAPHGSLFPRKPNRRGMGSPMQAPAWACSLQGGRRGQAAPERTPPEGTAPEPVTAAAPRSRRRAGRGLSAASWPRRRSRPPGELSLPGHRARRCRPFPKDYSSQDAGRWGRGPPGGARCILGVVVLKPASAAGGARCQASGRVPASLLSRSPCAFLSYRSP